jgi:DNA helicase II / ATP-dependent DNA helicase PcrA
VAASGFTPAQQRAITAGDGPVALVAGPGCGKTTALAARIAHLVRERQVEPASILALSFTSEAARRLRAEVARQLDARAADAAILTLHALGRRVIDTWAPRLGYDERPAVIHPHEARALLVSAAGALGWEPATLALPEPVHDVAELAPRPDGRAVFAAALLASVGMPVPTTE